MIVAGLVGSRIVYGLVNAREFARVCFRGGGEPRSAGGVLADCARILAVWQGGLVFYGGVARRGAGRLALRAARGLVVRRVRRSVRAGAGARATRSGGSAASPPAAASARWAAAALARGRSRAESSRSTSWPRWARSRPGWDDDARPAPDAALRGVRRARDLRGAARCCARAPAAARARCWWRISASTRRCASSSRCSGATSSAASSSRSRRRAWRGCCTCRRASRSSSRSASSAASPVRAGARSRCDSGCAAPAPPSTRRRLAAESAQRALRAMRPRSRRRVHPGRDARERDYATNAKALAARRRRHERRRQQEQRQEREEHERRQRRARPPRRAQPDQRSGPEHDQLGSERQLAVPPEAEADLSSDHRRAACRRVHGHVEHQCEKDAGTDRAARPPFRPTSAVAATSPRSTLHASAPTRLCEYGMKMRSYGLYAVKPGTIAIFSMPEQDEGREQQVRAPGPRGTATRATARAPSAWRPATRRSDR